ncbi:MAG TPA: hypothetical protein ENG03_09165 [Thioploca sp.]|nr:MAG: hypothetical protein DRR19_03005 [Gammaproteobacteria bacterium]HDN27245.1 hypothetical protein [Thioploca sp.]
MYRTTCLHVHGGGNANGANITQWDCVDQNHLKWQLELAE